jgi:hypothetical protein
MCVGNSVGNYDSKNNKEATNFNSPPEFIVVIQAGFEPGVTGVETKFLATNSF